MKLEELRRARVLVSFGSMYLVACGQEEWRVEARPSAGTPVTGDWVLVGERIEAILPRKSVFLRKRAGKATEPQALAANVDVAFLICGLDGDFNPRRLERYLLLTREAGVEAVVVLNKADLCTRVDAARQEAEAVARGVPVVTASARTGEGLDALPLFVGPEGTAVLLGSSGAGKSTIVNRLLGHEALPTAPVRAHDRRGRHTTTRRELLRMPGGWSLIDTPGLRELEPWADAAMVDDVFADVAELGRECRFRDCRHEGEPGCAVAGRLDPDRLRSYARLRREMEYLARQADERATAEERRRVKRLHREAKGFRYRW